MSAGRGLLLGLIFASGCSWLTGERLERETVTAACGMCRFHEEARGCYWAIQWEGEVYPVNGPTPQDHEAHGPEGMCVMDRKAIVTGNLRSGQFFADAFELLPVQPGEAPAEGAVHQHEHGKGWTGK